MYNRLLGQEALFEGDRRKGAGLPLAASAGHASIDQGGLVDIADGGLDQSGQGAIIVHSFSLAAYQTQRLRGAEALQRREAITRAMRALGEGGVTKTRSNETI